MKRLITLITLTALAAVIPISLQAQILVDVQFGGNTFNGYQAQLQTGAAATGNAGDQWNYVAKNGGFDYAALTSTGLSLKATDGNSSGVTLVGNGSIVGAFASNTPQVTDSATNLFQGYIVPESSRGSVYSFTFSGLLPTSSYDLVVFSGADGGNYRTSAYSIDGGSTFTDIGPSSSGITSLSESNNWIDLTGITSSTGTITLQAKSISDTELDINGFQLLASTPASVPEPSTYATLALGSAALLVAQRRKSIQG